MCSGAQALVIVAQGQKMTRGPDSQPGYTEHKQGAVHLRHPPWQPESEHTVAHPESGTEELDIEVVHIPDAQRACV